MVRGRDDLPGDERMTRLLEAARGLVDAYRQGATAKDDFERLAQAVEAVGGTGSARPADQETEATATVGPQTAAHPGEESGGGPSAGGEALGPQAEQAVRMARQDTAPAERPDEDPPGSHPAVS